MGGHHAWLDLHGLIGMARRRMYSAEMREALDGHLAQEDLVLNLERMRHWHPLNQDLYLGMKIHVPGLLLQAKGDRIAMHSSLELRYPFLDEDVIDFSTRVPPNWKLRGLRDKYLLRQVAAHRLPRDIVRRPKSDFVAPMDTLYGEHAPSFVNELLSEESLRRTGYFDVNAIQTRRRCLPRSSSQQRQEALRRNRPGSRGRHAALAPPLHRRQPGRSTYISSRPRWRDGGALG